MSDLRDVEKHRLRLYGEMLKSDIVQKRNQEKLAKQAILKRDSLDLERHIQNTRRMDLYKSLEKKQLNNAIKEDNMMLSTLKKSITFGKTYAEEGQYFINQIHEMDSKRLNRLKNELVKQFYDNKDLTSNKRQIEDKIKEIDKIEAQRHADRVMETQMGSIKSYEEIKKKHQQNMNIFENHKRLVQENQNYQNQLQSFTKVTGGILDRFNRNQEMQRKANLLENQDQIKKQMEQFERRKHQDTEEYKRKVGDLENSMFASILSKPQRYEPRAYSHDLLNQIRQDNIKKMEETNLKKEKIEFGGIFGGIHGSQRQKMMKMVDRKLGIDQFSQQHMSKSKKEENRQQMHSDSFINPEIPISESQRFATPKKEEGKLDHSLQLPPIKHLQNQQEAIINYSPSQGSNNSSQMRRYFKSYDLIAGKNRFYGAQ